MGGMNRAARELRVYLGDPCVYCGEPSETWDHLTARSRGGTIAIANLARACRRCNHEKGSDDLLTYLCRRALARVGGPSVKTQRAYKWFNESERQHREKLDARALARALTLADQQRVRARILARRYFATGLTT